jgi:hypothetical protein
MKEHDLRLKGNKSKGGRQELYGIIWQERTKMYTKRNLERLQLNACYMIWRHAISAEITMAK